MFFSVVRHHRVQLPPLQGLDPVLVFLLGFVGPCKLTDLVLSLLTKALLIKQSKVKELENTLLLQNNVNNRSVITEQPRNRLKNAKDLYQQ